MLIRGTTITCEIASGVIPDATFIDEDEDTYLRSVRIHAGCPHDVSVSARVIKSLSDEEHAAFFEQLTGLRANIDD